jgi:hypothetical protein
MEQALTIRALCILLAVPPNAQQAIDAKYVYYVMLHNETYPSRTSDDSAGSSEPRLVVSGNFKACNYWFQEYQSREQRRIARVDKNPEGAALGKDEYVVQVAASVDVALILLVTMIIDASEQDDQDKNDTFTGRCGAAPHASLASAPHLSPCQRFVQVVRC